MLIDKCKDKKEFLEFYKTHPMNDEIFTFNFIANSPFLFCCYSEDENKLIGYMCVYTDETKRLFLCGAGIRHNMPDNIRAIIKLCEAFNNDMYAVTDIKPAKILLVKAGFKKIEENLYVRFKNEQKKQK